MYRGDFAPASVIRYKFTTVDTTGAGSALSAATVKAYKDGSTTTEVTTGVTLTTSFDGVTGLNEVAVDTSDAFYAAGADYFIILTAGTVNGISVAGRSLFSFSLNNRAALRPTTAGRTLDVSAGGEAGLDWANVGSPTTSQTLSGTTVGTATTLTNAPSDSSGVTTLLTRVTAAVALESSLQGLITTIGASAAGVAAAVWNAVARTLTAGTNIVLAKGTGITGFNDIAAGAAMTLTAGERTAVANEVEAQIIDDTDSEKVLQAITDKIAAANPDLSGLTLSAIASAVRSALSTELARIDATITSRAATGAAMALTSAYDAAKTAAQASDIPSASTIASAAAAQVTTDHGAGSYIRNTEPPTSAQNRAEMDSTSTKLASIDGKTTNLPSDPADQSLIIAATDALVTALGALHNLSATDVLTQVNAALDAAVPDSIPADGSRPSVRQAAYMQTQFLVERTVSGTTVTVGKPDGTALFTLTLNDPDAPSSITRAA